MYSNVDVDTELGAGFNEHLLGTPQSSLRASLLIGATHNKNMHFVASVEVSHDGRRSSTSNLTNRDSSYKSTHPYNTSLFSIPKSLYYRHTAGFPAPSLCKPKSPQKPDPTFQTIDERKRHKDDPFIDFIIERTMHMKLRPTGAGTAGGVYSYVEAQEQRREARAR